MKRLILLILLLSGTVCPMCSGSTSGGYEPDPSTPSEPSDPDPETPLREGELRADGNTAGTYELITSCGYNYETPDTSGAHAEAPFQHIRQSYDETLGRYVFDFYIHVENDDDRGKPNITDRQRNEIKTDAKSPESMVGQVGDEMVVRWKFCLPEGMQTTKNFCHVHQIKGIDNSEGTADVGNPLITFTARTLSNGRQELQVIYVGPTSAATGNVYLARVPLSDFLGEWVEVEERLVCGMEGSYEVTVKRLSDGKELISVPRQTRAVWREGSTGMRPKWGIYRSFGEEGSLKPQLRDEILRFADFSVEKVVR